MTLPEEVVAVARQGEARAVDTDEFERQLLDTGEIVSDEEWWAKRSKPGTIYAE